MTAESKKPQSQYQNASAEPYVVLARKYRSSQFPDIVGQTSVVRTLMNAISQSRVHQAYLFTGSRGIGKTSIARIFSKVLRCEQRQTKKIRDQDWLVSCDACSSCREITLSTSVDVLEIDGASNNGVDAIREIREAAKFLPSTGSKKIYIIDEVHMLTTAAFNALLKTLEEPPPHVHFIFATTEPHKIPATILSRVQRFDFGKGTPLQLQTLLSEICTQEGVTIEPAAIALIARSAEGGMRDSLSLLDQVIAYSGKNITLKLAQEALGTLGTQVVLNFLRYVFERRSPEALSVISGVYQSGADLKLLVRSLIETLHGTLLWQAGISEMPQDLEFSQEDWVTLGELSKLRPMEEVEMIFQVFHFGLETLARSPQPKTVLDIFTLKCIHAEALGFATQPATPPTQIQTPSAPVQTPEARPAVQQTAPALMSIPQAAPTGPVTPMTYAPATYEGFIDFLKKTRPLLASLLEHGHAPKLPAPEEKFMIVQFAESESYFKTQIEARAQTEQIQALAKDYFGRVILFKYELGGVTQSLAAQREQDAKNREQSIRDKALDHPMIREARALFGGELGPIEISGGDSK